MGDKKIQKCVSDVTCSASLEGRKHLHNQLIKLGDMMGDGLHYEPGGRWISAEYRKIAKLLFPEIKAAEKRKSKLKKESINKKMQELMDRTKCKCGGTLKQKRTGTKVCYCIKCDTRYEMRSKNKRNSNG